MKYRIRIEIGPLDDDDFMNKPGVLLEGTADFDQNLEEEVRKQAATLLEGISDESDYWTRI